MDEIFEIGQWVSTEDGYGQVIKNVPIYVEPFETDQRTLKIGEFEHYIYICKILCDFDGNIKKRKLFNIYTCINIIDNEGESIVKKIKIKQQDDYINYVFYDTKEWLQRQVFLSYKSNHDDIDKMNKLYRLLPNQFTFRDLKREFNKIGFSFKITNFQEYAASSRNIHSNLTIRLDSDFYKVVKKETIFSGLSFFFKKDNE